MGAVPTKRLSHLKGQLAGGGQHERLGCGAGGVDFRQNRDRERRRLAGAGLRQPHHVGTRHQRGDGRSLNPRRGLVTDVGDCSHDRRMNL